MIEKDPNEISQDGLPLFLIVSQMSRYRYIVAVSVLWKVRHGLSSLRMLIVTGDMGRVCQRG